MRPPPLPGRICKQSLLEELPKMEHPSGEFLEAATNLSPQDTGDWEPPSTSLGRKQPSTVLRHH